MPEARYVDEKFCQERSDAIKEQIAGVKEMLAGIKEQLNELTGGDWKEKRNAERRIYKVMIGVIIGVVTVMFGTIGTIIAILRMAKIGS